MLTDLPTEILLEIGEAAAQGASKTEVLGRLRCINHRLALLFLPPLLVASDRCIILRRANGGLIDLSELESLCAKLVGTDTSVTSLAINWSSPSNRNISLTPDARIPSGHVSHILQRIKSLSIRHEFPVPRARRRESVLTPTYIQSQVWREDEGYLQHMHFLIRAMPALTSLYLTHVLHGNELLRNNQPSGLQQLTLYNVRVDQKVLLAFLWSTCETLRALSLKSVWMPGDHDTPFLFQHIQGSMYLFEFVYMTRRPGLMRPPSWKNHFFMLQLSFPGGVKVPGAGRGDHDFFQWQRPGATERFGHLDYSALPSGSDDGAIPVPALPTFSNGRWQYPTAYSQWGCLEKEPSGSSDIVMQQ